MPLEFDDLVIHKSFYDPCIILNSYNPCLSEAFSILLPTRLGHLFLEKTDDTIWFLNTWFHELTMVCTNYQDFKKRLTEEECFITEYFFPYLVADLQDSGMRAQAGQCYSPYVSPGMGGSYNPSNFLLTSLHVHIATSAAEHAAVTGTEETSK